MEKLKLYVIDVDYTKYLYGFDNRVMFWDSDKYVTDRKYIGVVLNINGFDYFAPLSSPKETDYFYKDGEKHIRKNTIPIVRLVTSKGELLGKIRLSNMIPVNQENLTLYDVNGEQDKKYQSLIFEELICIRKCKKEIIKNARVLYNQKVKGYSGIHYLDYTLDFKLLEAACTKYDNADTENSAETDNK